MTVPEDEFRRLLHEAADAAPVDDGALQADLAVAIDRARRARTVRTATASAVGVVLLGGVAWTAAAQPWNPPEPSPTSSATVTPTETSTPTPTPTPTSEPTPTPTPTPEETPEPPPAPEGSDIAYPVCGEVFALPERVPQLSLELQGDVQEIAVEGGTVPSMLTATVLATNDGTAPVEGGMDYAAFLVVTDLDGRVLVSGANPAYPTAEAGVILNLAAGDTTSFEAEARTYDPELECDSGATEPGRLVDPGSYQVFALRNVWRDGEVVQQAQGGPWTIDVPAELDGPPTLMPSEPLPGGVSLPVCGLPFDPRPTTGMSLEAGTIRSPRVASDYISELALTLTTDRPLAGVATASTVILTRDGVRVTEISGSDSGEHLYLSAGSVHETWAFSILQGCDFEPLPAGSYVAHPVVFDFDGDQYRVLAIAEGREVVIE